MDDLVLRRTALKALAERRQGDVEIVVGVGLDCTVWACWLGEYLALPVAYVREKAPKGYGRQRQVEGGVTEGHIVLLIAPDQERAAEATGLLGGRRVDVVLLADVLAQGYRAAAASAR